MLIAPWSCSAVLLTAVAFKLQDFKAISIGDASPWAGSWRLAIVEFESLLAAWLLSGFAPKWSRRASLFVFGSFACYSLYLVGKGSATCGCFGSVQVDPKLTALLDISVVATLLRWSPVESAPRRNGASTSFYLRAVAAASIIAIVAMSMFHYTSAQVAYSAGFSRSTNSVLLEPEEWLGKHFELAQHIDVGEQLMAGSWTVVLYHHDCSKCQEVLPEYEWAMSTYNLPDTNRLAVIEVPPLAETAQNSSDAPKNWVHGHLNSATRWVVKTPCEIRLVDGKVVAMLNEDLDLSAAAAGIYRRRSLSVE